MSLKPKFPQFEPYLWWTDRLTWVEDSFVELEAAFLWWFLPDRLQCIARAEMAAGNLPETLQLDRRTFVPLMSFSRPPFAATPPVDEITVHTAFAPGNYCHDGTACTYESDDPPGFLCFRDPNWVDDAGLD